MKDKDTITFLEASCKNPDGSYMFDHQTFYEGARWMRKKMEAQKKELLECMKHMKNILLDQGHTNEGVTLTWVNKLLEI